MYRKIHFSVDDTFGCFAWLNQNKIKEIFISSTFEYAKYIYERYGINTSFYCMYTDGKTTLDDMKLDWQAQFQKCQRWMKFGFHCYDDKSNYRKASIDKIKRDYSQTMNALVKITGGSDCLTDTLRLHYFAGNDTTIQYLKENGIKRLLCADDDRHSYNLSEKAENELKITGLYYDEKTEIEYVLTDLRAENIKNVKEEIGKIKKLNRTNITIFTHEKFLRMNEIKSNLDFLFQNL